MRQTSASKIHRYLRPCLAERSHWQSKYSSNLTWQFSLCLVPCFVPRGSSRVCSYSLSDLYPFWWPQKSKVLSRQLAGYSTEATGSDANGTWCFQMSDHKDVPITGFSATTSTVLPYGDTLHSNKITQPLAHPHESFGAVFLPLECPDKGYPPLLNLRLAFSQTLSFCWAPCRITAYSLCSISLALFLKGS